MYKSACALSTTYAHAPHRHPGYGWVAPARTRRRRRAPGSPPPARSSAAAERGLTTAAMSLAPGFRWPPASSGRSPPSPGRAARTSYLSHSALTPPRDMERFRLERMPSSRVASALPDSTHASAPGHRALRKPPRARHALTGDGPSGSAAAVAAAASSSPTCCCQRRRVFPPPGAFPPPRPARPWLTPRSPPSEGSRSPQGGLATTSVGVAAGRHSLQHPVWMSMLATGPRPAAAMECSASPTAPCGTAGG